MEKKECCALVVYRVTLPIATICTLQYKCSTSPQVNELMKLEPKAGTTLEHLEQSQFNEPL